MGVNLIQLLLLIDWMVFKKADNLLDIFIHENLQFKWICLIFIFNYPQLL